jgi:hypothetical protein
MTDETLWPHDKVTDWHVFISRAAKMLGTGIIPLTYLFRGQPDATKPLVPTLLRHFPPACTAEQVIAIGKNKGVGSLCLRTISRRVAGSWFIWFLRSVSCVWFNEPERQDRPAHQIDRL